MLGSSGDADARQWRGSFAAVQFCVQLLPLLSLLRVPGANGRQRVM
jgi:hypothetical protein